MTIVNLRDNQKLLQEAAEIMRDGFSDTGTNSWATTEECVKDAKASLDEKKISIIALLDGEVVGWAYGAPLYDNHTWELEMLVVKRSEKKKGIGRSLLAAFETVVLERGGLNVFLGTDDENNRTSLGGVELYPDPLKHLQNIKNVGGHPFEFYQNQGYVITGVLPDANGIGKPDIYMTKRLRCG